MIKSNHRCPLCDKYMHKQFTKGGSELRNVFCFECGVEYNPVREIHYIITESGKKNRLIGVRV